MSIVLAQNRGWLEPGKPAFENVVCGPFKPLREAVRSGGADFFMWEHFTTKKFWDNGELKRIGEESGSDELTFTLGLQEPPNLG